ncbi:MAG: hypothetical protein F6J97_15800 [Leptolyngbya sp. SIO4C1]|nr:hypothetical protein [Leptolyngbya sp. SIO4C1]
MLSLSFDEIAQLKSQLADYPDAVSALQEIEDCDGDVEDAALSLALRAGLEPDTNEAWLSGFAKRYRHILCQQGFRQDIQANRLVGIVNHLTQDTSCPSLLAAPVSIYVYKQGIDQFCHSFDNSRV